VVGVGAFGSVSDAPADAGNPVTNGTVRHRMTFIANSRRTVPLDYRKGKNAVTDNAMFPIPRKYPIQRRSNSGVIRYKNTRCGFC
jgi:hypothetical protein